MKHLWGGDGRGGEGFFWADPDFEPKHRDYYHLKACPTCTGQKIEWEWRKSDYGGRTYVPVCRETIYVGVRERRGN